MAGRVGVVATAGPTRGPAVVALLYVVELAPQSRYAPGVSQTPESLGTGIGPLLADFIPLMPSGARRAGAAQVMAARVGRDPSLLVDNPRVTQLLAMGLGAVGGAYTADQSKPVRAAAMLGPLAIVQLLRHLELNSIQKSYDTEKRKRLRELDDKALLDNPGWFGGSNRLGAVNAYETMRDRKYKGYSSIAEAGDAFHLAASGLHPLLGVSMSGIVSALDNEEAEARRRMHKKADFAEQRNSPVIPLTIAAGLLGSLGRSASQNWAVREVSNTPPLGVDKWPGTIASISGTEPLMLASDADGTANAFFYKPDTEKEGLQFMRQFSGLRDVTPRTPTTKGEYGRAMEKLQRLMRSGVMVANERAGAPVIGHEAGHAKIEETPGMLRFLQRHIYPHQGWVAPMAAAGSMAAGLASGSTLKGGLYGTGIGLLSSLGTVGPEAGASYHALKHLKSLGDGSLSAEGKKDLLSALSTYLAGGVLPSVLSGMAGGWISGRRRKKEDEEGVEKQANTAARVASRVASRIAKIFRPAQFTHTGVAPGKNLSGVQPKMWEAWRQHAHLQQMREGLATSKPNFSFNVPHPNTGAMVPHDVHLADSILHTSPNYKPHDRLLTHARIRNTATGQTWEQPMYRSSGATVGHGGTAPAAGHWLPTSGVHGADPSYLAKAQRANAATRARYPNTPEVNYDTYAKTLSDPRVAAQRVMPGTEPGWIGKQQFDPASGQWVTHDKTDKTLLPIYQHLRDAMGEYAGQLKTASLLIEEGVEKSAAYVPVENAFEKAAAAWQEMRKSGTVGMLEPIRRPRVATGKIPMNWDAEPRPTAPGKAPGDEIYLMDSKSTVNPADFKTPYYGDQFPAQLEQAAQYNLKNKLPNTTDGWQRPVTVVTSNPTSNSQYAPFVRQGIHGNAVFMPADAGKFLRSQAPEMVAAGAKPADVVAHEVNHAAGENWAAGEHDDAYFVGSTKDPGYAGRQNFMDRLPHDLIPGEHRGYMSTIQAQMFKDTGSRITSPEAYDKWLESMNVHHADPAVFENSIKSVPVDAQRMLRGMRDPAADPAYLKSLKQWQRRVMPGIVQQAAPMQEKYAALDLRKAWQVLRRIRTEGLTGDMADGLASSLDSKARTLQKHFFSHPDVMRMGIKSRMPSHKIQDMLKGLTAPPAVPALPPPPAAPIQGMLDLFKQGQAHPALPALRAAKEHSDAGDYSMKHKLIRQNMRRHADDWSIDSDDGKGIVGVTHIPTGFRLHMPKGIVDPDVLRYHNATQPKSMQKTAGFENYLRGAKRWLGLTNELDKPLFGERIARLARRQGTGTTSWGTLDTYSNKAEGVAAEMARLKEEGIPGYNTFSSKDGDHAVHNLKNFGGVLADYQNALPGRIRRGIERRGGEVLTGSLNSADALRLSDKRFEADMLSRIGGVSTYDTRKAMQAAGISPKARSVSKSQAATYLEHLKQQAGGRGFVVKPEVSNASVASTLITQDSDPAYVAKVLSKGIRNLFGDSIGHEGPARWMAQERVNIRKMPWLDRVTDNLYQGHGLLDSLSGKALGAHSLDQQVRTHVMNGKVIPFATQWRGSDNAPVADFFMKSKLRQAERETQKFIDRLPAQYRKGSFGFDMARSDRGWVPLEMNVAHGGDGSSGLMQYNSTNDEALRAAMEGVLPDTEVRRRLLRSKVLGGAGVGSLALYGGINAMRPTAPVQENGMHKRADDNMWRDTAIGAGAAMALPASSHLVYEAVDRPRYQRQINELLAQALAEKKFYAAPSSAGYATWKNPLQKRMQLGDVILQSHGGDALKDLLRQGELPDFTTLSLGGSGGPFAHAAVSTRTGRAIDPGKMDAGAFKDEIINMLVNPGRINRQGIRDLLDMRRVSPRSTADAKYLAQHGTDAFESAFDRANASVVIRPRNLSGIKANELQRRIADIKSVGYSGTDALVAGLKRLWLPFRPMNLQRGLPDLSSGTFCSHGACASQAMLGHGTPAYHEVLPPDLLQSKGHDLVGIGVNREAIEDLGKGLKLRGQERLAEAAKRTFANTMRAATSSRRTFAAGLAGAVGLIGAGAGAVGNKLFGD